MAALILVASVYSAIQSATPNIIGIDGYYHVKVAALMWQQGWRLLAPLDFPWLQLTILGPGRYSDHHFLFHALQAPFTMGDLRVGAKMASVLFATLGLYTSYHFLARNDVRYPVLWIGLLIACAPTFLWRHSMARPQALFLALLIGAIWAVFAGRPRLLAPLGLLAVLLFDGFPFLLGIPLAALAARGVCRVMGKALTPRPPLPHAGEGEDGCLVSPSPIRGGRDRGVGVPLAALGWAALGVALGLLLHPYAPRNLEFAYLHLLPKAVPSDQLDVAVGQEWAAFTPSGFARRVAPIAAVTVLGVVPPLALLARRRVPDWRTVMLGGIAFGFMAMAARSQRLIEYYPFFGALFCAWSWGHVGSTGVQDIGGLLQGASAAFRRHLARRAGVAFASHGSRADSACAGQHSAADSLVVMHSSPALASPGRPDVGPGAAVRRRVRAAADWWPYLVGALLLPVVILSVTVARRDADNGLPWDTYRRAALWLAQNTPAESRVFTTDWDDFPHMFFWNTHNTYLTGLDPTYTSIYDPALYRLWRDVQGGRVPRPSGTILGTFGARYVVSDLKHGAFLRAAADDPDLEQVLKTDAVVVFRIRDAAG